ncbi:hypothetical protein GCM10008090_29650 [Arenicella chitinivorans]|uniref:Uncharacterized protein n=1 Tax=Arenicella chitinivorans TaxID=1329800 RepID=A0A918VPU5_9GAMM|nr:hypothetical protein [Arenicella chitinivorans]GHA17988.1 hypothetical protein GCM10008090_29650 [Arenicella chitinivorans]
MLKLKLNLFLVLATGLTTVGLANAMVASKEHASLLVPIIGLLLDDDGEQSIVDSDNDGVPDHLDAFPFDPNEQSDSDGDGLGDNRDPRPNTPESIIVLTAEQQQSSIALHWFTNLPSGCRVLSSHNRQRPERVHVNGLGRATEYQLLLNANQVGQYQVFIECYDNLGNSLFSEPMNIEVGA